MTVFWVAASGSLRTAGAAVAGAAVFAAGLHWLRRRAHRDLATLGHKTANVPLRPRLRLQVEARPAPVIKLLEAGVRRLAAGRRDIVFERHAEGFVALLPATLRHGYGERIEVSLTPRDTDQVEITISSRPRREGVLIDLGRNLHHVLTLRRMLESEFGRDRLVDRGLDEAPEEAA
ncbi:MAG: hypothetical protein MUC71_12560 [Steroidobacteraceae bacterium]|nr:hypothetical protein [Steroidobacteraceae bacterium]